MADFSKPTVGSDYADFPGEIISNVNAALQQLSVGSPSNIPANAIKFDTTLNRWRKYNGSAFEDLTSNYNLNANLEITQLNLGDNERIRLGDSQDLQIYHENTNNNTIISETGAGSLLIQSSAVNIGNADGTQQYLETSSAQIIFKSGGNEKFKVDSSGGKFNDSNKLRLGTDDDLQLYHNGSTSYITDNGTGSLIINSVDGTIELRVNNTESAVKCFQNGAVELYHDNLPKLATGQFGVDVTGSLSASNIDLVDNAKLLLGTDDDLQIFHDGSNSYIYEGGAGNLAIQSTGAEIQLAKGGTFAHMVRAVVDGQVELYHAGNLAFTTTADGIVTSTNSGEGSITIKGGEGGASALIFHADEGDNNNDKYRWIATDNEALFLQNFASGGWETNIKVIGNGGVELYFDNSVKKFETTSGGVNIFGSIGTTGELDFNGNNNKFVDFETIDNSKYVEFRHFNSGGTFEKFIRADANGTTELFHNGNKKIETDENGVTVSGILNVSSTNPRISFTDIDNASGLDTFSLRGSSGKFRVRSETDGTDRLTVQSNGNTEINGSLIVTGEIGLFDASPNQAANDHRFIDAGLGDGNDLRIRGCSGGDSNHENMIVATRGGSVKLYHDGGSTPKLATSATGVTVDGTVSATAFSGDGSALTGIAQAVRSMKEVTSTGESEVTSSSQTLTKLTLTINCLSTSRVLLFYGFEHQHSNGSNNHGVITTITGTGTNLIGGDIANRNNESSYEKIEGTAFDINSSSGNRTYNMNVTRTSNTGRIKNAYFVAIEFTV
jgi:hypothetical protein|tara:strand:- start:48 stop:2390 length:2343 start_codon:yes stop_codon:yes gene_type:complete